MAWKTCVCISQLTENISGGGGGGGGGDLEAHQLLN